MIDIEFPAFHFKFAFHLFVNRYLGITYYIIFSLDFQQFSEKFYQQFVLHSDTMRQNMSKQREETAIPA